MPETAKEAVMAKSSKRKAARNKSSSKPKKAAKRAPKMAAKRALSKKTSKKTTKKAKSKPRRVTPTAMEPMVQTREPAASLEPVEVVVVEATTVIAVERPAADTVVVE